MKEITKERTITEKYTLYEAFDGQEFTDKKECQKYEESALGVARGKLQSLIVSESNDAWSLMGGCDDHEVVAIKFWNSTDTDAFLQWLYLECPWYLNDSQKERKAEVEADLQEEANHKFFSVWSGNSSKKREFVSDTLEEEYNERISNWEELKQYHETIQSCVEAQTNAEFQKEFNECKKAIEDELYGDDAYVNQQLFEANSKLNFQIPFDVTLDVDYNKVDGIIDATASLPSLITIPDKKAVPLTSGKISVKDKLKRELDADTANTLLGLSYYLAGHLFNLSVNVSIVRLSVVTGFSAYYWVEFNRNSFSALSFSSLYPLQDFFSHPNVIDYTKSSIELISESDFRQRIKDAIKVSDMLSHNPDLIVLSVNEAEKIIKILDGTDDLKQAVKEAKSNRSSVVVANKRYKNVLSEIDDD
jgi:hypothetical protein